MKSLIKVTNKEAQDLVFKLYKVKIRNYDSSIRDMLKQLESE